MRIRNPPPALRESGVQPTSLPTQPDTPRRKRSAFSTAAAAAAPDSHLREWSRATAARPLGQSSVTRFRL